MNKTALIRVGKILKSHGIKGELKVFFDVDLADYCNLIKDESGNILNIQYQRRYKEKLHVIKFEQYDHISQIDQFLGLDLYLDINDLDKQSDLYFELSVRNLEAFDDSGEFLGKVLEICDFGGGKLLRVIDDKENEEFFPASYIKEKNDTKVILRKMEFA